MSSLGLVPLGTAKLLPGEVPTLLVRVGRRKLIGTLSLTPPDPCVGRAGDYEVCSGQIADLQHNIKFQKLASARSVGSLELHLLNGLCASEAGMHSIQVFYLRREPK